MWVNYERKGWELEDGLREGLGPSTHSMIDCDLPCHRAGAGRIITFFPLFILPLLNLSGNKSKHRFRSLFLGIYSAIL